MDCTVCLYGETTTTTLLSWLQLSVITCASSSSAAMSHVFICLGEDAKGEKNSSSRDDLGV